MNEGLIEELKDKLEIVSEERDCALEMWELAKQVAENIHEGTPSEIRREMEEMKMEYSEAIKLLENKCQHLEALYKNSTNENQKLVVKIGELTVKIREFEREISTNDIVIKTLQREKESLRLSLDHTKDMLNKAEQSGLEARDKVAEALGMAQEALANEASVAEEKSQLEDELTKQTLNYEHRILKEVEKVRTDSEMKIDQLSSQLHTVTIEKNRLSHEVESLKAECRVVEKQISVSNKNLLRELEDLRTKKQKETSLWFEERDNLRRQVTVLQGELETMLAEARKTHEPCVDCEDFRSQIERYKKLARRWEEAADRVTADFERYLDDSRDRYCSNENSHQPAGREEIA